MFNIADIVGILILVLMVFWGSRKGLVKSVLGLISLILSITLAVSLYPLVSDFLEDSVVGDYVYLNVYKAFDVQETEDTDINNETLNLPQTVQKAVGDAVSKATGTVKESVAKTVATLAIELLSMLIVFILVKLILWLLTVVLDLFAKLPVIRSMNRLLGGVIGCCYGVLIIYLLLALLTFTTTLNTFNKPIEMVLESRYLSTMYNQNILLNFLK